MILLARDPLVAKATQLCQWKLLRLWQKLGIYDVNGHTVWSWATKVRAGRTSCRKRNCFKVRIKSSGAQDAVQISRSFFLPLLHA